MVTQLTAEFRFNLKKSVSSVARMLIARGVVTDDCIEAERAESCNKTKETKTGTTMPA